MPVPAEARLTWRKSSYSGADNHSNCVEVAWRKSSYSDGNNGNCVEIAPTPTATLVRDSKAPDAGQLTVPSAAWSTFLTALRP